MRRFSLRNTSFSPMIAIVATALFAGGPACSGGDKGDDTGGDADADTDADTDTDTDVDTGSRDPDAASLTGTIAYADGSPITAGVQVRLCDTVCLLGTLDGSGGFTFSKAGASTHAFEVVMLGQQETYGTPLAPIVLAPGEDRVLDATVRVYEFVDRTDMTTATTVSADGGLTITAFPTSMSPTVNSPSTDTYVASVRVDPSEAGLPIDGVEGTVVGQWYLGNFESTVDPAWAFEVANDFGLDAGTSLRIYGANYDEKAWVEGGTATVGDDGVTTSDSGSGIPMLTTLLLVAD